MSEVKHKQRHGWVYDPAIRQLQQTLEVATSTKANPEVASLVLYQQAILAPIHVQGDN